MRTDEAMTVQKIHDALTAEIAQMRAENAQVRLENERLRAENVTLRGAIDTIWHAAKAARELTSEQNMEGKCSTESK